MAVVSKLALIFSILAIVLVILLFVLVLFTQKSDHNRSLKDLARKKQIYPLPEYVDVVAQDKIDLQELPQVIDGISLRDGQIICLLYQLETGENGLYRVENDQTWTHFMPQEDVPEGHRLNVREGQIGGRSALVSEGDALQMQYHRHIIQDKDIPRTPRHLTSMEAARGVIITESDVLLPVPTDLGFTVTGEIKVLHVFNRNTQESVELGFDDSWDLRGDNTIIGPINGVQFMLRAIDDGARGEVYRSIPVSQ